MACLLLISLSAFSKINSGDTAFLFESIEGGENWARYSFLGSGANQVIWEEKGKVRIRKGRKTETLPLNANPLKHIQEMLAPFKPVHVPLPGAVLQDPSRFRRWENWGLNAEGA